MCTCVYILQLWDLNASGDYSGKVRKHQARLKEFEPKDPTPQKKTWVSSEPRLVFGNLLHPWIESPDGGYLVSTAGAPAYSLD